MSARAGLARLLGIVVVALIAGSGYTAYAGDRVYQGLQDGREQLVAAQISIKAGQRTADLLQIRDAARVLTKAEQDFNDAERRARSDPALRAVSGVAAPGRQVDGAAHLAAIGADLSRAGEAAAAIAQPVAQLRQRYAGRSLSASDLQAILQEAQAIAINYQTSIDQIGRELQAAHEERAAVTTTNLVAPLRGAYDQVDRALADADSTFLRYQDVRQVVSELFNTAFPA